MTGKPKKPRAAIKAGTAVTAGSGRSYVVKKIRELGPGAPRLCVCEPTSGLPGPKCLILPEPLVRG